VRIALELKGQKPMATVQIQEVANFWETHPLCASAIPYPLGTPEYFRYYDELREANESVKFSYRVHEYGNFSGHKVLDVGAGNGYVLSKYAQEGAKVWGVDITKTAIDLCSKRFKLFGLKGEFLVANAEELPFESDSFDCVCSMGVLHHTPDTAKAVDEIFRVLKSGGRLIVMVYHRNSALYRVKFPMISLVTGKTIQQLVNEVDGVGNPKGSVFSKDELYRLLNKFKELDLFPGLLQGWMLFPRGGRIFPGRWLRKLEKYGGWFLYAKGRKP
jgi:ubiquinone/menaquinone biosynthesis C-methylase UbiE